MASVRFNRRALADLVPAEWSAVRDRARVLPEGWIVRVSAKTAHGPYMARVNGQVYRVAGYPTAYDAAQAGLARLEGER